MTVTEYIARSDLPTFGDPRDGLPRDLVTPFSAFDLEAGEAFLICIHKRFVDRVPARFLWRAVGASEVVHADGVYIVVEVMPAWNENTFVRTHHEATHAALLHQT